MNELSMILEVMKAKSSAFSGDYYIPEKWNSFGYRKFTKDNDRPGEIKVNPYDFYGSAIEKILGQRNKRGSDTESNAIYSILARSFTAWPHYKKSEICYGSFLKAIALLPMLEQYNVSIVYLLPICKCGEHYNKGEIGSPYAIRDFYKLDSNLHDPLLGEYSDEIIEIEFKAFVEACHLLGMRVIVDFAFRTVARDNVLIKEHPDWFYWIKSEFNDSFKPPMMGDGKKSHFLNDRTVKHLYTAPSFKDYIAKFSLPPNEIDPAKWEKVKSCGKGSVDERILKEFGITTVPGFSNIINDRQPPWTDVTYLKYYFDPAPQVQRYIPKGQPPFIMQDGTSLNLYHGNVKNTELWDYIIGILPFYKKVYGIDGARIDMAHAMPAELNALIIEKVRELDKDFILWSEELNSEKGGQAKKDGFNLISGYTYMAYKNVGQPRFNESLLQNSLLKSELPLVASVETPDTPRSAYIHKSPRMLRLVTILNNFAPNSIPMIVSGQDLKEIQPMNLGLDNDESGRFVLPESDQMYGKLAFFDLYSLHWMNDSGDIVKVLRDTLEIRKEYLPLLTGKDNFILQPQILRNKKLTTLGYYDKTTGVGLFVAANRSETSRALLKKEYFPEEFAGGNLTIIYDNTGRCERAITLKKNIYLRPTEVLIISFKKQ